jgi:hypothetical protein
MWESHRQVRVIGIVPGQAFAQHSHDEVFECTLYGSIWLEVVGSDPHPHLHSTSGSHL